MKLIIAIIQDRDTDSAMQALVSKGFRVTRAATSGGFLEQGNATLLSGVDDAQVSAVIEVLRDACHRRPIFIPMAAGITDPAYGVQAQIEVEVGGATVFVLDVEQFLQI